jgi:NifU-like protein involved in Fe-S cluster formation
MGHSAAVIDRARNPKYVGWLPRDAPDVGTGEAGTRFMETAVRIQVRIDRATRRVDEAVFKASGSAVAAACASLTAERLGGATIEDARELSALAIVAELALPVEQASVATYAIEAAQNAVDDWERKQ